MQPVDGVGTPSLLVDPSGEVRIVGRSGSTSGCVGSGPLYQACLFFFRVVTDSSEVGRAIALINSFDDPEGGGSL